MSTNAFNLGPLFKTRFNFVFRVSPTLPSIFERLIFINFFFYRSSEQSVYQEHLYQNDLAWSTPALPHLSARKRLPTTTSLSSTSSWLHFLVLKTRDLHRKEGRLDRASCQLSLSCTTDARSPGQTGYTKIQSWGEWLTV